MLELSNQWREGGGGRCIIFLIKYFLITYVNIIGGYLFSILFSKIVFQNNIFPDQYSGQIIL